MNFEELIEDIKHTLLYTTNLKTDNETLHNKITSLEHHVNSLETLIQDKDRTITELMHNISTADNAALDKIIQLQADQTLRHDFRTLSQQHDQLQRKLDEKEQFHSSFVVELKLEAEDDIKQLAAKHQDFVAELKSGSDSKVEELTEEVAGLKEKLESTEKQIGEDKVRLQKEYEDKLQVIQRSSSASVNVDIYKRKLAAQKMEGMREVERLKQHLQHLQQANKRRKY